MSHNRKLGKPTDQRIAMLRAMTTYLLENGQIKTTVSRAKAAGWARFFAYGGRDRKSQPSPCILQEAVLYYTPINQKGDGEPSWTNLRLVAST